MKNSYLGSAKRSVVLTIHAFLTRLAGKIHINAHQFNSLVSSVPLINAFLQKYKESHMVDNAN